MQALERTDSKYMAVVCSLRCQKQPNSSKEVDVTLCKLKWSDDKRALFEQNLNLPENLSEIERARSLIDVDVNEAVGVFTAALSKVASCMVTKNKAAEKGFQMNGTTRNVETCEGQQEKHLGNFHVHA